MQPAQWRIAGILPVSLPRQQNEMPWADRRPRTARVRQLVSILRISPTGNVIAIVIEVAHAWQPTQAGNPLKLMHAVAPTHRWIAAR